MESFTSISENLFESIKHINEYNQEYWSARELMPVLEYKQWRQFSDTIERAKKAFEISGNSPSEHFANDRKTSPMPNGGVKYIDDYKLSRYACYLIAMNGDPRKEAIALAQTYFAIKTRQQEIIDNYNLLTEDQKRLAIRNELKVHNKSLAAAAQQAGVKSGVEYAVFQNYGYMGLYGGLSAQDIAKKKGLKKGQAILDHMESTELAANLFRATQTDDKLRREHIKGIEAANRTHYQVGQKVRKTIKELGGTMPENLPTPKKSIKQIEGEQKKQFIEKSEKKNGENPLE